MGWTLADIKTKVRDLTGRPTTGQLSEANLEKYINDFYVYTLPSEIGLLDLETWFELETSATDTGAYALDSAMQYITTPMTIDGVPISFSQDPHYFFGLFPRDAEATAARNKPTHCLLYDRIIYLRPKPDAVYTFKTAVGKRPTAMSVAGDTPEDEAWGPVIAYGASIDIHMDNGESLEAKEKLGFYNYWLGLITRNQILSLRRLRSKPRF